MATPNQSPSKPSISSSQSPKLNGRIKTKPQNYNELIELTREDVHTVWEEEKLCMKYVSWMERAIKSTKDPVKFLQYMEYYVEECLFELNEIETPCHSPDNYGKAGEQPSMSPQTNNMIYEVIPKLTESLAYTKPTNTSVFPLNHFFRLILILCKRCIELDIECFRLLEIIFGFVRKDVNKFRFYDTNGLPQSSGGHGHGYRRNDYEWRPKLYGNGEMSLFLRIKELEALKKESKQKWDQLIAKSEEMEEYEEEIEVEVEVEIEEEVQIEIEMEMEMEAKEENNNEAKKGVNDNIEQEKHAQEKEPNENENETKNGDNPLAESDIDNNAKNVKENAETTTDENIENAAKNNEETTETETESVAEEKKAEIEAVKTRTVTQMVTKMEKKTITKTRQKQLSGKEKEVMKELQVSFESYSAELALMIDESNKIYYISHYNDYPHSYLFCGGANEKSRDESWFRVQNINYWGKIGGFSTMLARITHAKCAVAVSDLVNLIRPVAQLRDLLNRDYFESFVLKLRESLKAYYKDLPDLVVRELNKQTVEKSLKNLHYMMNNHYNIEEINEAKEKLKLQIAGRQFRAPYAQSRIFGMNDITRFIDLAIEKHQLKKSKKASSWIMGGMGLTQEQKQREQSILNLWLDIKFINAWIEEEGVLEFILNAKKTAQIELIKRLGPIYKLLKFNNNLNITKHIDPLWDLTLVVGQHEAIRYIIYDLICELAESLNLEQIKHLFQQIAKTPKQDYDTQILQLIKKTTVQAFEKQEVWDRRHNITAEEESNENEEKQSEENTKKKDKKSWFGLDLLWKFVQSADAAGGGDGGKVKRLISEKTAREALQIFLELLSMEYAISQRNAYMEKCIWHIQESQKVVQNLQLLQQLIQTFPRIVKTWWGSDTTQKPNTQNGVIERLERDYAIIDHLLQDLAFYKGTVMSMDVSEKTSIQTMRVDSSSFGYLEQIKIRQDFLLFLLTHSGLRLTRAQYRRIWDHLVGGALCREEMDLCYIWLLRGSIPPHFSSSNDSHYRLYNQQDQRYLFENCIRRLPAAHLSETGYLLVVSFFCSVNKRAGTLSIKGEKKKLPRRAGDGQGITQIKTNVNTIKSKFNGAGRKEEEGIFVRKEPTRKTREHLLKFVKNMNTDRLLNEDGTYLIDPDDHYIDSVRLRVIDYGGLDGLSYFWDIVLKAVLPSVGLQAIELLNALHFYFAPRIKSKDRDDIRQKHVQKCLRNLDEALKSDQNQDKNKIIVKRMIMLLKQFLESFVNNLGFGSDEQKSGIVDIEISPDKEFRTKPYLQTMKLTDTFGHLRKKILAKLSNLNSGLILEHLIIKWNDKYTITMEEHDRFRLSKLDWSQSRILEIKRVRYAFTRYFWMVPQSQQPISDGYPYPIQLSSNNDGHSGQDVMSGFKRVNALQIFSANENIYNQLFPLLQRQGIGPAVWDILNLLPPSHIRVRRIIDLGFESKFIPKRWNDIFDLKKPYQLLYYLQILCSIFSGEEWKKEYFQGNRMRQRAQISHLEWIQRFVNLGGFSFVTQLLFKIDLTNNKNSQSDKEKRRINVNCVAYLFQIVSLLLSMDKTFKSVISSNKCVRDGSITNFKDFPYIEGKLIQTALNISQKILLWSDLAAKQKQEEEQKHMDVQMEQDVVVQQPRHLKGHLQIRRQVSDFSNLSNISDLGPNGATILVECLQIMIGCIRTNPKYVDALFEMEHLTQWLTSLLLNTQYPATRPSVSMALQMLSQIGEETNIKLLSELIQIFQSKNKRSQTPDCHEFFELLLHVFDHVCREYKLNNEKYLLKCKTIANNAFITLRQYASSEKYNEPDINDEYLVGILNVIRIAAHHILYDAEEVLVLCEYIFYECLFNVPQQNDYGAKCKAAYSRRIAYALIHKLNEKYPATLALIQLIILKDPIWNHMSHESLVKASWHYHPSDLERFPVRYVGLKNQGATCYMNSLVQQLFIVDDFRRAILSARTNNEQQLPDNDSVLYQIQLLFGYLMKSQKKYYDTMPLCRVLKGFDGEPLPVGEQQDVNEFCARLFDQLETNLKGCNSSASTKCIDLAFGGTLINQMISQEDAESGCGHKSEREEAFHTVSLTVKNKSSLRESLELYVKGDILDGDNKWQCGKCNSKRAALKRSCFGKLSKYLILHLSRFEFDFNLMRRKKLNSRFEFPLHLNMEKYTKEGLHKQEQEKEREKLRKRRKKDKKEEKKEEKNDEEEDEYILPSHPPEYYQYSLVGVVVHTGGAEAGHYYSYAQSSDTKWWEFNDVDVLPFDVLDLDAETFGGKHFVTVDDPKGAKGKKIRKECDKPFNAYMLIYKQVLATKTESQKDSQSFEQENNALTLPPPIQQTIWSENLKFLCDKNVFDFDYLTFLWQTVQLSTVRGDNNGLQAIQIATCFVFEILIRAKDNGTFPRWMRMLYKMYQQSSIGRKWFLNKVSTNKQWFINTMFHNAHKPARLAFVDLLLAIVHYQSVSDREYYAQFVSNISVLNSAMNGDNIYEDNMDLNNPYLGWPNIDENEEKGMENIIAGLDSDKYCCARFIVAMFRFLHLSPKFHRSYEEFFKLLLGIAHNSWHERYLLINLGCIRSIVAFYLNDSPILHFNRQVVGRSESGQRSTRRIAPPRVQDIIKLLSILIRSASTATFPPINNSHAVPDDNDNDEEPPDLPPEPEEENEFAVATPNGTESAKEAETAETGTTSEVVVVVEESMEIKDDDIVDYYGAPFELSLVANGSSAYYFGINNELGRGVILPDDDRRCVWNGLDLNLGANISACEPWDVPSTIDPLPSFPAYNKFIEQQQALNTYKKKNGKECKLPINLQRISDIIDSRKNVGGIYAPRKVTNVNIIDWLFRDRNGPQNKCLFAKECIAILTYSCFNNWMLSEIIFDYLYRKVAEEFKASHEYGPYLKCIQELLISDKNDLFYKKKIQTFLPKIISLFKRCSKTDDVGTDLLLFQLTSFLVRLSFNDEFAAQIIKQDEGLLDECMEEYRHNHGHHYQIHHQQQAQHHNQQQMANYDNDQRKKITRGFNMRRQ